ncbi:STAS domain-containing protein [Streptomyces flavofungini]|uniref:STAS domain-containing protein n=1 Tax=Streptomyces flavofungini TaxID=68200 RepID=UPI0025AF63CA|nr:STAS domain-containing protein [Streptomyces flavofungini]WJV47195.1 STAS domain-containing protein [Streptomyces flavofungini]
MGLTRTPTLPHYVMTLTLDGELDTRSTPALCALTSQVLAEGSRHLTLDLAAVTHCDNASLFTLLGIRQAIHHAGGSLTLANPSHVVQLALAHSNLRDRLPLHDDLAQQPPHHPARSDTARSPPAASDSTP